VDVAEQLQEVRLFLHQDGLEAVLEEVAGAAVAAVEVDGIPGEQAAHQGGERRRAAAKQDVKMVGDEAPSIDGGFGFQGKVADSGKEVSPIGIGQEDLRPFDTARNHVVKDARSVEARTARHGGLEVARRCLYVKYIRRRKKWAKSTYVPIAPIKIGKE
jgi:hypothetical protein